MDQFFTAVSKSSWAFLFLSICSFSFWYHIVVLPASLPLSEKAFDNPKTAPESKATPPTTKLIGQSIAPNPIVIPAMIGHRTPKTPTIHTRAVTATPIAVASLGFSLAQSLIFSTIGTTDCTSFDSVGIKNPPITSPRVATASFRLE